MTNRIPMKGATLKIEIASTPTQIPQVTSADTILGGETAMIDITDLDDTAVQSTAGLLDYGTMDFKGNWDPSNSVHQAILSQWAAGTAATFLATLSDTNAGTISTVGPIKTLKLTGGGPNDLARFECSQKINSYVITP